MDHTNAIYAEVDPSGNAYVVDMQKNECYQTPAVTTTFKTPSPVEKPSSSIKAVVILGLIFATLVLLLGGVAAATAYALVDIYNMKSAISLDEAVALQQNTDFSSKLEMLLTQELDSRIQQLQYSHNSTVQRVNILEDVAETMRVYQQVTQEHRGELETAVRQVNASINSFQQQSAQNHKMLDTRITQVEMSCNNQYNTLNSMINTNSQQSTASISALQQQSAQNHSALDTRIAQVETSCSNQYNTLSSSITQVHTSSQNAAQQNTASISSLQQQSAQNYTALDARLDSHVSSSNTAHQQLTNSISAVVNSILGQVSQSCDNLPTSFPAGYYYFLSSTGSAVRQYCPSITTRCGLRGRWRSVANLDMTRTYSQCPADLILQRHYSKRLCTRHSNSRGCSSVQLSTNTPYRSVCGFVKAYQFGQPEAFEGPSSIDSYYVDGVSITHGSPRQHIWTFAATYASGRRGCPCMGGSNIRPSFVGNDYFCDTGSYYSSGSVFYGNDPLWDGAGCDWPSNTCCSFNTPPWFYKELSQYTHDNIELRICSDYYRNNEDTFLEAFAIYVK